MINNNLINTTKQKIWRRAIKILLAQTLLWTYAITWVWAANAEADPDKITPGIETSIPSKLTDDKAGLSPENNEFAIRVGNSSADGTLISVSYDASMFPIMLACPGGFGGSLAKEPVPNAYKSWGSWSCAFVSMLEKLWDKNKSPEKGTLSLVVTVRDDRSLTANFLASSFSHDLTRRLIKGLRLRSGADLLTFPKDYTPTKENYRLACKSYGVQPEKVDFEKPMQAVRLKVVFSNEQ